jgi:amino acid adenylation domain-containing protein/non-ribosomal peptide synthase protein (TIGR01720 family)
MRLTDFCSVIAEAASRFPEKTAVEHAAGSLSYADLVRDADRIAHGLLRRGLERGAPIGILLPAGAAYVQAFLGAARAGGAPMPLDMNAPPDRQQRLLDRSRCRLVIDDGFVAETDAAGELPRARPEDPCYVMSTSGSTGEPKAILGCHRGLSHFLRWEIEEFGLDESARVSALAPTTFDVSLRDMLVPLCLGGTLCIPAEETRTQPRHLLAWLAESRITLMHIVPTLFRLLLAELESGDAPRPESLRHVLLAGEPLYGSDVARWRAVMGNAAELVNLYGPSETTLAKVFFRIGDRELEPNRAVPIGDPLPNTALLILDSGRLCGIGEIGEIHIKTPYRTLGYLNDPEQTAGAFVDNPLNPGQGDVIYRTGDLGRYLPGRQVECLGRLDNQIKLNGIRIEPAEIESAVRHLPGIADTVVVGHRTAAQQMSLACYYTQQDPASPVTVEALRAHLASCLPAALIPGFFVEMRELPYTVSGKVARKALPRPEELLYERRPYRGPSDPVEEGLARIWGEVLGLGRVGVDHPFVELGGDSLKAIRATSAIYRAFGVEIGLKEMFEQGTVAALAKLVAGSRSATAETIPALPPAPDHPVSHAQRRLWTLDRMEIDSVAYNLPLAFRLAGPLDTGRLQAALARLVERHEALRTTFVMAGKELRQRVSEAPDAPLIVENTEDVPSEEALERLVEEERSRPFDLARGPLFRARLLRRSAEDHVLLFNIHHIICDVWSLGVMMRELRALWADPAADLPPLPLQYRDFAAWQNARLANGGLDPGRAWWLDHLAGELPVLDLPADFPRPAVQTFNGTTLRRGLGPEVTEGLARLGTALDASLFVLLQSLARVLLHRLTGQRDLVLGTPVVGRQHPGLESQVGLYVNTLALRDAVDPETPFRDLVARGRQTTREAAAHQDYPFDVLVDELGLERDMSRSPLFDVMVVLQEEDPEPFALDGVRVAPFGRETAWNFSRFDMVLHFMRQDGELVLDLNYNTDLFLPERAERTAAQLEELARSAVAAPGRAIGDLSLLPPAERALLESFGQGAPMPVAGETIVEVFEAQAARTPAHTALVHGDRSLTYRELNEEANRLAHFLLDGIERGDRVAVAAGRSIQAMIAMLGILKAGAVYVPVDPALPRERLLHLLDDSGCRWVLTDGEPPPTPAPWLRIADARSDRRQNPAPAMPLTGRDLAYMIYTSGSTGRPKGVLVEHAGFVNMSLCQIEVFGQDADDRVLQFASSSFDASLAETFSALLCGGALVLVDRETIDHPADFLRYLEEQEITVVTLPPVYLSALGRPPMPGLRVLITAGEPAQVGDALFYGRGKDCFNAYGPTEISVCASIHRVDPGRGYAASIPVGAPVANTSVFVLDERLNPVPVGVPGEICVAGPGLARGYHGRPDSTAARFVPHPFCPGERLYRTGDRGRWLSDGNLEFLGRLDHQVKIHGHRVELRGVESALRACDGVGDVFVTLMNEALTAYYTPPRRAELWPSVAEFLVYDDVLYGSMARDEQRNLLYKGAFGERLRGATVLEVGPGAELVLSRLALEAGAEHVFAVELLQQTWERARARVEELGLGDRITLIHGDATQADLGTQVDACISEIVGGIGGSEGAAFILNSVRRFLKRPDAMLPRRAVTRLAAVSLPEELLRQGFSEIAAHYVRRIFEQEGGPFDLRLCVKNLPPESLLSDAGVLEDLDFTRDVPLEADHDTRLTVAREGRLTGFLAWLQLHVDETRVLDILGQEASWLPVYLPLFAEPVEVRPGDHLDLAVSRRLSATGIHPDYHLRGLLRRPGREDVLPDVELSCDAWHRARSFRGTPFYDRLFAGGEVPVVPDVPAEELRRQLLERLPRYEVPAYLVKMDRLPLNSNGKVDRGALPDPRPREEAPVLVAITAIDGLEKRIAAAWRDVLGCAVGPDDNFFTLGGDSIKAIRIVSLLHQEDVRLEVRDLFGHPTVRRSAAVARVGRTRIPQGPVTGELPPTPIQLWFFDRFRNAPHHFNQSVVLWAGERLDPTALRNALEAVQRHHDALRLRFHDGRGRFAPVGSPVWLEELTGTEEEWHQQAASIQAGFRLDGPLMRAVLVHLPERDALWLLCHHLVVDAASWPILIDDLETAYRGALAGEDARLPAKTSSWQDFAAALAAWTPEEREHWRQVCARPRDPLPGRPAGEQPPRSRTVELHLAPGQIRAARPDEVLFAALGLALRRWGGMQRCLVDVETHGRAAPFEGLDVSRTVGWFTAFFPVPLETGEEPGEALRRGREALRNVPSGGLGYGVLTRMSADPLPEARPEIGFNYLGELDGPARSGGLFAVDWEAPGPPVSPDTEPVHALDVLGAVLDGSLVVSLTYDARRFSSDRMHALLAEMRECLLRLVDHCASVETPTTAAAEFTFQGLSSDQLDQILSDLGALRAAE